MIFPVAGRGRPRKNAIPDIISVSAQAMLETVPWRKVSWRRGTKGPLSARFADGSPQRIHDMGAQHLPGDTPIKQLAGAIKARWVCEQVHQQLKEELGLDHFEGRSWKGLHRHALMSMIAFAFLHSLRLKQAKGGKRIAGPPPQPGLPKIRHAIIDRLARPPHRPCPHCGRRPSEPTQQNLPK
jgi:SRSO17 transposase